MCFSLSYTISCTDASGINVVRRIYSNFSSIWSIFCRCSEQKTIKSWDFKTTAVIKLGLDLPVKNFYDH